ncbi:acetyl-coenzyme A synthetase N-terminal domain-containing protein, partial [Oleiphilus sp. HI0067]
MTEQHIYPVSPELEEFSTLNKDQYLELYKASIDDPESFWAEQAKRIDWFKPFTKVKDVSYASKDLHIRWFEDGILNASYNCLDRHLADKGDQTAIIYEGDDPSQSEHISYKQL